MTENSFSEWRKYPSFAEFLKMSDAQRIAMKDQADAAIRDEIPEAEAAIRKTNDLTAEILYLCKSSPRAALIVIESVNEILPILNFLAQRKHDE